MKILDIAFKDMLRSFRSAFAIGMMFIVPLMITGLIFLAFGGTSLGKSDLPVTKLVVVNRDVPPAGAPMSFGEELIKMFNDPSVSKWLVASSATDEATAMAMVNQQQAGVAVLIPENLTQSVMNRHGNAQIRIIQDPTLTIGPMVIRNMVGSLLDGASMATVAMSTAAQRGEALGKPVDLDGQLALVTKLGDWYINFQRTLYHSAQAAIIANAPVADQADSAQQDGFKRIMAITLAGQMIFFGFFTAANSMASILQEQEEGTLARIFTTPTSRTQVLGGKFLAVVFMVIVQALVMIVAGRLLFGVEWGNPLSVALSVIGQVLGATGLGVLLISLIKTSKQTGPVLGGALCGLGILGGVFTVAVPNAPKIFDLSGMFVPHGWVLRAWKATLAGSGPADLLLPLAVLIVMGVAMFAIGAWTFQKRFA